MALAWLAAGGAVALALACHEGVGPGACFESGARAYRFDYQNDTNLVFHWPSSYNPVRVYAEPTGNLPATVQTAMALWTGAFHCRELTLTAAADSTHADIVVRSVVSLPAAVRAARVLYADTSSACRGVTQVPLDSAGTALDGPMRSFVAPFPGADSAVVAACYRFVTAHELGHALGILAHSPDTADLMYQSPRRLALSADDRYTIQLLYHVASKIGPPPRP